MLGVSDDTVVLLNHRDDILDKDFLESTTHAASHLSKACTTHTRTRTTLTRSTLRTWALRTLAGCALWTLTLRTRTTKAHRLFTRTTSVKTIVHVDNERYGLACSNQVVHNDTCLALS